MMPDRESPETDRMPLALLHYMDAVLLLAAGLQSKGIGWDKMPQYIELLELYYIRHEQRAELAGKRGRACSSQVERLKELNEWRAIRKKILLLKRTFGKYASGPLARIFSEDEYQYLYPRAPSIPASPWLMREVRVIEITEGNSPAYESSLI